MDKYTGSLLGLGGAVGDPLEDHHEDQVAKQRDHEEQLRDKHKEHTSDLAKVPGENNNNKGKQRNKNVWGKAWINMKRNKNGSNKWNMMIYQ